MVYEWRAGTRISIDPKEVGKELERIAERNAANVVRAASKSKGALHRCFEWDDAKAGEAHRLEQARYLLRMIVTVEEPTTPEAEPVRYRTYEAVQLEASEDDLAPAMVYVPTREALSDPELREQVMDRLSNTVIRAEEMTKQYEGLVPRFKMTRAKLKEARETIRA